MKKGKTTPENVTVEAPVTPTVAPSTEQHVQLGRPVDPNSKRQQVIKERKLKREQGLLKRGRPVVEGSKRQLTLQERETKIASGVKLEKGRPIDPNSKRQHELKLKAERAAARAAAAAAPQQA